MTLLIETRGVSKHYGAFRALDDVSIAVRAGEFVSIVGPNGAGKTTLVNLLTGLLVPTNGEVYFKGENYDLFYPAYGDSYPSLRGAVGMTYEMAGGGRGGLSVDLADGSVLLLSTNQFAGTEAARN